MSVLIWKSSHRRASFILMGSGVTLGGGRDKDGWMVMTQGGPWAALVSRGRSLTSGWNSGSLFSLPTSASWEVVLIASADKEGS
jgi:hypothetical protein